MYLLPITFIHIWSHTNGSSWLCQHIITAVYVVSHVMVKSIHNEILSLRCVIILKKEKSIPFSFFNMMTHLKERISLISYMTKVVFLLSHWWVFVLNASYPNCKAMLSYFKAKFMLLIKSRMEYGRIGDYYYPLSTFLA